MKKIYLVYEGNYDDDHYYGTDGYEEEMVAIYPDKALAKKHMELWKEKTQIEVDETLNPEIVKNVEELNAIERELNHSLTEPELWVFNSKRSDEYHNIFTRYDGGYEKYCRFVEYDVSDQVKVE